MQYNLYYDVHVNYRTKKIHLEIMIISYVCMLMTSRCGLRVYIGFLMIKHSPNSILRTKKYYNAKKLFEKFQFDDSK